MIQNQEKEIQEDEIQEKEIQEDEIQEKEIQEEEGENQEDEDIDNSADTSKKHGRDSDIIDQQKSKKITSMCYKSNYMFLEN